jgi:P4 family phage/plasmid primase-like protien
LEGFVVDDALKPLNREEINSKQLKKIKLASETCMKELEKSMPSFGKINVQDIANVRKCMHSVVNELHVKGLLDRFDQDRAIANAPNGLIDLRTGALLPHHPQDLCNNQTSEYVPDASKRPAARFQTFLMEVLSPKAISWLQMFLGYCLTGETSEELFVIANGLSGANGKGVLKQALRKAFGSYNCAENKAIFIKPTFKANASAASTHLKQIQTKRFVTNDESEGVKELHASFVKEASGGGELDARELYCKPQSYVPQFKLYLFTNFRPHFPSDDTALIRRIVLIMFNYTFKNSDELDENNIPHKPIDLSLKPHFESDEGAADTLDFCVQGAMLYYAKKALAPALKVLSSIPVAFKAAAKEYAEENDKLQAFHR